MAGGKRLRKRMEWRERLARFDRADTTIAEFCSREGVSTPAFYAWRKRLADGADSSRAAAEVLDYDSGRHGPFASVRVTGGALGGGQVTVWLRGGTRLEIPLAEPNARTVIEAILHADAAQAGGRPC
jgi:hypothetical protein